MATQTKKDQPPSPARSDESNESEGRPVREKLKETRIDAQGTFDQAMKDAPTNGTRADPSTSGSDSERAALRRKRSRENFEEDDEGNDPDKKQERHVRKKSREGTPTEPGDEKTTKLAGPVDEDQLPDKHVAGVASPKNKRTREQAEAGAEAIVAPAADSTKESSSTAKVEDERTTKRPRDTETLNETTETKTKIPEGSGFANTSAASPFATMSPKPQATKSTEASTKGLPQTSEKAFQNSGFGSFAKAKSPFDLGSGSGSASPFGATGSAKLSSFASSTAAPTNKPSGFAGTESKSGSAFGGFASVKPSASSFGSSAVFGSKPLGQQPPPSGFAAVGSSIGKGFGSGNTITGLGNKTERPFGSKEAPAKSEKAKNEDGEDGSDNESDAESEAQEGSERRASQPLLNSQGPPETGEENEDSLFTGRAKLYALAGEAGKKSWQERGVGGLKLNITREKPRKARFVLRADGTHRLLLNAAVTASMRFGNQEGKEPEDGKLMFAVPTASGEVETYLLKTKAERALELWNMVEGLKQDL